MILRYEKANEEVESISVSTAATAAEALFLNSSFSKQYIVIFKAGFLESPDSIIRASSSSSFSVRLDNNSSSSQLLVVIEESVGILQ
jgi:hypothetical protein